MTASTEKTNRSEPFDRPRKLVQEPLHYDVLMQPGIMMVRVHHSRERWCPAA